MYWKQGDSMPLGHKHPKPQKMVMPQQLGKRFYLHIKQT